MMPASVHGASSNAVALEGFLDQGARSWGRASRRPPPRGRGGAISNLVPAGPERTSSRLAHRCDYRQHFTFGTDVRLLSWSLFGILPQTTWRVSAFLDLAPRYQNFGFSFGPWH